MSAVAAGSHDHDHDHDHDALATTRADPTRTTTLRRRYGQRLRAEFADINTEIRSGVRDRDVFGLSDTGSDALAPTIPPFEFDRNDQKIEAFIRWLRRAERNGVLEVIDRGQNTYIRSAYGRGLEHAAQELRKAGVDVTTAELSATFAQPVHEQALQLLYTRNYEALRGITEEVDRQISRILTDGFRQGWNPNKMAREITDRVDKIGKTRATTLARTEVINAHSEGTLNRFEREGVGEVTIRSEFSTASDRRVCPLCRAREGTIVTIEKARTATFRFEADEDQPDSLSGEYPIKPPIHPRCRCSWLPVVS